MAFACHSRGCKVLVPSYFQTITSIVWLGVMRLCLLPLFSQGKPRYQFLEAGLSLVLVALKKESSVPVWNQKGPSHWQASALTTPSPPPPPPSQYFCCYRADMSFLWNIFVLKCFLWYFCCCCNYMYFWGYWGKCMVRKIRVAFTQPLFMKSAF